MKTPLKFFIITTLLTLSILDLQRSTCLGQGTVFTYQGRLNDNGQPANGTNYGMAFYLYDAPTNGNVLGNLGIVSVSVSNGLFTVPLNFDNVFDGGPRWLEISVQKNGGGFTTLAPRQQILPAPYAIMANSASNLLGMLPTVQLSGAILASQLSGSVGTATNFSGSLGGDVTGTQSATVVSTVGGLGAADVASGASTANAATSAAIANTIIKRDANGNSTNASVTLNGNLNLPATTASAGIIYSGNDPLIHAYGIYNFFAGAGAGNLTMSGSGDTGVGYQALHNDTNGLGNNTAVGYHALFLNTNGSDNTAIGLNALVLTTSGSDNTAIGLNALGNNTTGSANIALGNQAGYYISGDFNIDIGNVGYNTDNKTIRIGGLQTNTYIAGIYGVTIPSGVPVYVNSDGQLGTLTSSARFKKDIKDMDDASDVLLSLQPVTFRYKPDIDPQGIPQFGLVAEEVEKVSPALVVHDEQGRPYTVRYEAVNAMLLNEFLKEHKKLQEQSTEIQKLNQNVAELKAMVEKMAGK